MPKDLLLSTRRTPSSCFLIWLTGVNIHVFAITLYKRQHYTYIPGDVVINIILLYTRPTGIMGSRDWILIAGGEWVQIEPSYMRTGDKRKLSSELNCNAGANIYTTDPCIRASRDTQETPRIETSYEVQVWLEIGPPNKWHYFSETFGLRVALVWILKWGNRIPFDKLARPE